MEILVTIAYVFLARLIFFDYELLRLDMSWKIGLNHLQDPFRARQSPRAGRRHGCFTELYAAEIRPRGALRSLSPAPLEETR